MEIVVTQRRPRRRLRAATTLLSVCSTLLGIAFILPSLFGLQRFVITGTSMTGTIDYGSIAFEDVVPVADLRVGDIITYQPPAGSHVENMVTHRIVAIHGTTFRTKGDAVPQRDPWKFRLDHAEQSRVKFAVPYAGYPFIWLADRQTRMLVIGGPAAVITLLSFGQVVQALRRKPRPGAADTAAEPSVSVAGLTDAQPGSPRPQRAAPWKQCARGCRVLGRHLDPSAASAGQHLGCPGLDASHRRGLRPADGVQGAGVPITATASDDRSAIDPASVTVEFAVAGSTTWTPFSGCTTSGTNPLTASCTWDTTLLPDGDYQVRARATDAAGYSTTSAVEPTSIVNNPGVVLDPFAGAVNAGVQLTTSLFNAGNSTAKFALEYSADGWRDLDVDLHGQERHHPDLLVGLHRLGRGQLCRPGARRLQQRALRGQPGGLRRPHQPDRVPDRPDRAAQRHRRPDGYRRRRRLERGIRGLRVPPLRCR